MPSVLGFEDLEDSSQADIDQKSLDFIQEDIENSVAIDASRLGLKDLEDSSQTNIVQKPLDLIQEDIEDPNDLVTIEKEMRAQRLALQKHNVSQITGTTHPSGKPLDPIQEDIVNPNDLVVIEKEMSVQRLALQKHNVSQTTGTNHPSGKPLIYTELITKKQQSSKGCIIL